MGFTDFLRNYTVGKGEQVGSGIIGLIAAWDPKGATEADIKCFRDQLDVVTHQAVDAKEAYQLKKGLADKATSDFNLQLNVAKKLQKQLEEAEGAEGTKDEAKIASLTASLTTQVGNAEKAKVKMEEAVQLAEKAMKFRDDWVKAAEILATKIASTRKESEEAQQEVASAQLAVQAAKEERQQTEILAGIINHTDRAGTAIGALKEKAARLRKDAEADTLASQSITKATAVVDIPTDTNIAAAMQEVKGDSAEAPKSAKERLAALG